MICPSFTGDHVEGNELIWLILASFIWAFSFGLIKGAIQNLDPFLMSSIRMGIAFLGALIFWRPGGVDARQGRAAAVSGLVQVGFMYAPYMVAFRHLKAHEVALFTMTTPLIVVILHQFQERRVTWRPYGAALIAVLGGSIVAWKNLESGSMLYGILLVQVSNVFFATGQYLFIRCMGGSTVSIWRIAPYYFGGAFAGSLFCLTIALLFGSQVRMPSYSEWLVLLWLGLVASGLGFATWSYGSLKVSYAKLAVASDLKLPIAVLVSIFIFREQADITRVLVGGLLLAGAVRMAK